MRKKLLLSTIILFSAVLLCIYLISNYFISSFLISEQFNYDMNSFNQIEKSLKAIFETSEGYVQNLLINPAISKRITTNYNADQDYAQINDTLLDLNGIYSNINTGYIKSTILLGKNGLVYIKSDSIKFSYFGVANYELFYNEYLKRIVTETNVPVFFKESIPKVNDETDIHKIVDILNNNIILVRELRNSSDKVEGAVIFVYDNRFINDIISNTSKNQNVVLLDTRQNVIWSSSLAAAKINKEIVNYHKDFHVVNSENGDRMLYTSTVLIPYSFQIVSKTPVRSIFKKIQRDYTYTLIFAICCFILVLFISLFFSKKITKPIHTLSAKLNDETNFTDGYIATKEKVLWPNLNLHRKLLVYYIITLFIPCVIFFSLLTLLNYNAYKEKIIELTMENLNQAKWNLDYKFNYYDYITSQYIFSNNVQETLSNISETNFEKPDFSLLSDQFNNIRMSSKEFLYLTVYAEDGTVLYSSNYLDKISIEKKYNDFLSIMSKNIGTPVLFGISRDFNMNPVLSYTKKIRSIKSTIYSASIGKLLGYAVFSLDQDYFDTLASSIKLGDSGFFFIMDQYNKIFMHDKHSQIFSLLDNDIKFQKYISNNKNGFFSTVLNNDSYIIFFDTMNTFNLKISGIIKSNYITLKMIPLIIYNVVTFIIIILLIIIVSLIISSNITHRLKKLEDAMHNVNNGNLKVSITLKGKDEITTLIMYFNEMVKTLNRLINENYKAKIRENELLYLEKEAQLNYLQHQINPHFLYNTLESIKWMAYEKGNIEVSKMASVLGKFYHGSISSDKELVTIRDEIEHLKSYIYIQNIRYQDKFNITWEIDEDVIQYKTIKLILQPIVENAIIHGMENIKSGGLIIIRSYKKGNSVCFEVSDNGKGMTEKQLYELCKSSLSLEDNITRKSIGMNNVFKRLKLYYNDDCSFDIDSTEGKGTIVRIIVPTEIN